MGRVIHMDDYAVTPKTYEHSYGKHRVRITFDPNEPPQRRWMWEVSYTQIIRTYGHSPTPEKARKAAETRIENQERLYDHRG